LNVDARVIKVGDGTNVGAYSARSLAKDVLVPRAVAARVDLGVYGREPLNNQPYFRIDRVDDTAPIHDNATAAFEIVLDLLNRIDAFSSEDEARAALRAFVLVRREHAPVYPQIQSSEILDPRKLVWAIEQFVRENSEGGRRAQAVVAGLLDTSYSPSRVESGRINDPSRHYPGDVVVWAMDGRTIEKAFEVRDKKVSVTDALIFLRKAVEAHVGEAIVVACHPNQLRLESSELVEHARSSGLEVSLFYTWDQFVWQVLLWGPVSQWQAAALAYESIARRLRLIEVHVQSAHLWNTLIHS
jgi:hypothetical protein